MRTVASFTTRAGTPLIMVASRALFALLALGVLLTLRQGIWPESVLTMPWVLYLVAIYGGAEYFYQFLRVRGIDMTFAFPILLAIFTLNVASNLLGGQEELVLLNRVEHFSSFVLLTYAVVVFTEAFLPAAVIREHPYYVALLVLSITALCGVANEIIELLFDGLLDTAHVGSGFDTSLDLLMNTLGSGLLVSVRLILRLSPQ